MASRPETRRVTGRRSFRDSMALFRRKRHLVYGRYIAKTRTDLNQNYGQNIFPLTMASMRILNDFACDMEARITEQAALLMRKRKGKTLKKRDIKYATRMVVPGELGKISERNAEMACNKYAASVPKPRPASKSRAPIPQKRPRLHPSVAAKSPRRTVGAQAELIRSGEHQDVSSSSSSYGSDSAAGSARTDARVKETTKIFAGLGEPAAAYPELPDPIA